jgi:hypothetical protein
LVDDCVNKVVLDDFMVVVLVLLIDRLIDSVSSLLLDK